MLNKYSVCLNDFLKLNMEQNTYFCSLNKVIAYWEEVLLYGEYEIEF